MDERDTIQKELRRVTQLIGISRDGLLLMLRTGLGSDHPDVVTQTQHFHELLEEQKRLRAQLGQEPTAWPPTSE